MPVKVGALDHLVINVAVAAPDQNDPSATGLNACNSC